MKCKYLDMKNMCLYKRQGNKGKRKLPTCKYEKDTCPYLNKIKFESILK